jgi:DNA recombination protein RmuC
MDTGTLVIVVLLALALALLTALIIILLRRTGDDSQARLDAAVNLLKAELFGKQQESLLVLKGSLDTAGRQLHDQLAEGHQAIDKRLAMFGEIEGKLGELAERARHIEQVGRNIQSLSELLRPPKLRGQLGELFLENLLGQVLPDQLYERQHRFADGRRVDAVVKLGDVLLPVDAKFPLEGYQRVIDSPDDAAAQKQFDTAFRKHVDDIAARYIRPREDTTEFAMMYIPAEAIYYHIIARGDGSALSYALGKRVVPTSPGHLYAFLTTASSVFGHLGLTDHSAADFTRRLLAGLNEMADMLGRLAGFHQRIEGSLRSMSISFEKARDETAGISRQLDRLREPGPVPGRSEP